MTSEDRWWTFEGLFLRHKSAWHFIFRGLRSKNFTKSVDNPDFLLEKQPKELKNEICD